MFWVIWLATSVCKKFKFLWFFDPVPRLLLQCGSGSTSLVQTRFLNVTPPMMNQLTLAFLFLAQDFALCSTFKEIDSQNATVRGQMDAMRSLLEELGKAFHEFNRGLLNSDADPYDLLYGSRIRKFSIRIRIQDPHPREKKFNLFIFSTVQFFQEKKSNLYLT